MSEKKYAPQENYIKNKIRRFVLNLNKSTDQDILAHLDQLPNIQGYLKQLIRADMQKRPAQEDK